MKKIVVSTLLIAVLGPFSARAEQGSGTLASFLASHGLIGAKLERRFGNHLFVSCSINNKHAALMIDTGAPVTFIDTNSVGTFGLSVEKTGTNVGGALGRSWEHYGKSKVRTIAFGSCMLTNVPVGLMDMSSTNTSFLTIPLAHVNGLLGGREMRKFGMIIDCTRQMLYINPNGPSAAVSQSLAGFFAGKGFTRIPLHLESSGHFDLEGAINGDNTRFVLDTGAPNTCIDQHVALKAGLGYNPMPHFRSGGAEGQSQMMRNADVDELAIGSFKIHKANVEVLNLSPEVLQAKGGNESNAGFFGAEYLAFNFGVIDVGGLALYLRHPD